MKSTKKISSPLFISFAWMNRLKCPTYKNMLFFCSFFHVLYKHKAEMKKVLTSLCKRKQIMVRVMAFSYKTGSSNSFPKLDVSVPASGYLYPMFPAQGHFLKLRMHAFHPVPFQVIVRHRLLFFWPEQTNLWRSARWGGGGGLRRNERVWPSDAKACPWRAVL